jgi:hypothetical protein
MKHSGMHIIRHDNGDITTSNPALITILLVQKELNECIAVPSPHLDGHDLSEIGSEDTTVDIKKISIRAR